MTNRSKEYTLTERGLVGPAQVLRLLPQLETTEDRVWLSRTSVCQRHTLRGVPARRIDVLVDQRIHDGATDPRDVLVGEVGQKLGRYDGAERPRLTLRVLRASHATALSLQPIDLRVTVTPGDDRQPQSIAVVLGSWRGEWDRLRTELDTDEGSLRRIIAWHWMRWYAHLPHAEVATLLDTWLPHPGATLAEANRDASRALYAAARAAGWAKLTLREKRRLGYDDAEPQWMREADVAERRALRAGMSATGAGEYTLEAARGDAAYRVERITQAWEEGADTP